MTQNRGPRQAPLAELRRAIDEELAWLKDKLVAAVEDLDSDAAFEIEWDDKTGETTRRIDPEGLTMLLEEVDDAGDIPNVVYELEDRLERALRNLSRPKSRVIQPPPERVPLIIKCHICDGDPAGRWREPAVEIYHDFYAEEGREVTVDEEGNAHDRGFAYSCRRHLTPRRELELQAGERARGWRAEEVR